MPGLSRPFWPPDPVQFCRGVALNTDRVYNGRTAEEQALFGD
jgi:hypothetical protein